MKTFMKKKGFLYVLFFVLVNIGMVVVLVGKEQRYIEESLYGHAQNAQEHVEEVMENYIHSFQLFSNMMAREIENQPDPDAIWNYLKEIDPQMKAIEGDTFDGLYMYYQDRYLYSWDTPYEQYVQDGYIASERPWYKDAMAHKGEIVFTPPYMSFANHYILSTISQVQEDGETVFAYDIKMSDIQDLVSTLQAYDHEQIMIFDANGTVVGSTQEMYLGGDLSASLSSLSEQMESIKQRIQNPSFSDEQKAKLQDEYASMESFFAFREQTDDLETTLIEQNQKVMKVDVDGEKQYAYVWHGDTYSFLLLVPIRSMLMASSQVWLLPFLIVELLLVYVLNRVSKWEKNKELQEAYVELGQTQRRLEIALSAAQKAAAIDDLTGMMNFKSFRKAVDDTIHTMEKTERGILIMMDGDRFKSINDTYGHMVGDEVIKLTAQMIVGRIRTVDLASRLHGDEFAIFVSDTDDYQVAKRIIDDINESAKKEAKKRNMPSITVSAGAVIAYSKDSYTELAKIADEALYRAKETHNGAFYGMPIKDEE